MRLLFALYSRIEHLVHELMKFGVVGAFAYVIDVGTFNLLLLGSSPISHKPITAKLISSLLAITFAYFGNRHWTFRHRDRIGMAREYSTFLAINGVGITIALAILAISHYALGFTSKLADNISANVIGIGLASVFRFWAYRKWVFPEIAEDELTSLDAQAESAPLSR